MKRFTSVEGITRTKDPIGRVYNTPMGSFYSVTTILGKTKDMSGLDEWRKRIGNKPADRILKLAGLDGTCFHEMLEASLDGKEYTGIQYPIGKRLYRQAYPIAKKNVGHIYAQELYIFSKTLKLAGTVDLVADWNGIPSIIDFKSCGYLPKDDRYIKDYWIQISLYRHMIEEMYGLSCPQLVLLFSAKKVQRAKVITCHHNKYARDTIERVKEWRLWLTENA